MESPHIIMEQVSKGEVTCQIPITKDDWRQILVNPKLTTPSVRRALMSFYFMPEHKATCTQCANKYGYTKNTYNNAIWQFGKAIINYLGTFVVENSNGERTFWPIAMGNGRPLKDGSDAFEWTLREELVEVLRENLMQDILKKYLAELPENWIDERYKWEAVQWFQDRWNIDAEDFGSMFETATAKGANLLASAHFTPRQMILEFIKHDPEEVRSMFAMLYDESQPLETRTESFMDRAEAMRKKYTPAAKNHYQNTNAISTYLWLRYPEKYLIFKSTEYISVAEKTGMDYSIKQNGKAAEMIKGFKMYAELNQTLKNSQDAKDALSKLTGDDPTLYKDPNFQTLTIDFGYWISRWYTSLEKSLYLNQTTEMNPFIQQACNLLQSKKNLILQGAPGTGKTYNTAALALAIIDGSVPESHDEIMARYEELRSDGRIGFTTFHQSMDYEDFIEGIKPVNEAGAVRYEIEDGIFKQLCTSARENIINSKKSDSEIEQQVTFEKMFEELVEHIENSEIDSLPIKTPGKSMKIEGVSDFGNIILKTDGTSKEITYTVSFDRIKPILEAYPDYNSFKGISNINNTFRDLIGGCHSSSIWAVLNYLYSHKPSDKVTVKEKVGIQSYVLIIDEINRANVSKVFGELITLIEKDKRLGADHPVTLSLPYSKQKDFGVPQNIYIIGTMNTTDRSTGTLDYAIRRRFAFLTIPAKRDIIKDETAKLLFDDVKQFIESHKYADMDIEDLMVGHSYFMADNDDELAMKIQFEVIPLIKEYIKDGILSVKRDESDRYFESWLQLQPVNDSNSGTSED